MPVKCTCQQCETIFYLKPSAVKRGRGKFCSKQCRGAYYFSGKRNPSYKAALKKRLCVKCGKEFETYLSQIKNGGGVFCSKSCRSSYVNTGSKNGNWNGGKYAAGGYVAVSVGASQRKYEHQVIAEDALGRSLKKGEVVHHVNGDKSDNRNVNLLVCSSSYHHFLHQKMARLYQHEKFGNL